MCVPVRLRSGCGAVPVEVGLRCSAAGLQVPAVSSAEREGEGSRERPREGGAQRLEAGRLCAALVESLSPSSRPALGPALLQNRLWALLPRCSLQSRSLFGSSVQAELGEVEMNISGVVMPRWTVWLAERGSMASVRTRPLRRLVMGEDRVLSSRGSESKAVRRDCY